MNNNNLDQITMQSSKRKIARFNLKHTNDTSFGIGEIQALMCKEVVPGSNNVFSITNVVRLDPMVAPTFGELKLHHNVAFVGMSDLFPVKFAALLAQQPVQFGLAQAVPKYLPYTKLKYLSALCLIGSKYTIYKAQSGNDNDPFRTLRLFDYQWAGATADSNSTSDVPSMEIPDSAGVTFFNNIHWGTATAGLPAANKVFQPSSPTLGTISVGQDFFGYDGPMVNIGRMLGWSNDEFWIPTQNWTAESCFGYSDSVRDVKVSGKYSEFCNLETIGCGHDSNYDACYLGGFSSAFNSAGYLIAFRFSDFGKRMYKLLLGLGYGFDLKSDAQVSMSKLYATYMAWFYSFAPTLYQGWETTNCAKLLSDYDSSYDYDLTQPFEITAASMSSNEEAVATSLIKFFIDLGSMWNTEEQDFVTAHIRSNAVSPSQDLASYMNGNGASSNSKASPNVNGVVNVTDNPAVVAEPNLAQNVNNAHAYINNILHTALDSEVLKRLYKVVNRNTIAGRRIKNLLEAQGLGAYVKQAKSNFIGHYACDIEVFDVTATADTLQVASGEGMYTGEYVGKGVGDGKSKRLKFKAGEFGFIIDLAAIVPEAGWTNGTDLSTRNVVKLDFHHPEYEALGLEASPKSIVTGVCPFSYSGLSSPLEDTFGFIPRETRHKVTQNILNGNFGLHSVQKAYLPYTFNKFIEVGVRYARPLDRGSNKYIDFEMRKLLSPERLPIASPMYRFIGRYPWMGRFMRIFANLGRDAQANYPTYFDDYAASTGESMRWFFCGNSSDPFLVHNVFLYDYYAPMLPIEDSFETHEEGNNGYTDLSMGKA